MPDTERVNRRDQLTACGVLAAFARGDHEGATVLINDAQAAGRAGHVLAGLLDTLLRMLPELGNPANLAAIERQAARFASDPDLDA